MRFFSLSGLPEGGRESSDGLPERGRSRSSASDDRGRREGAEDPRDRRRLALRADERGLASVEYVVLLVTVTLGAALLIAAMGPAFIRSFEWQVAVLGLPVP